MPRQDQIPPQRFLQANSISDCTSPIEKELDKPKKNLQTIRPCQLVIEACTDAIIPQNMTTKAAQIWGGNCFQPMRVHCERISGLVH